MTLIVAAFLAATAAVLTLGPRLARAVETLAGRIGLGNVLAGAVLLGVVTSLPGLVLTVTAAAGGEADLAVSNALGGVAAQTVFIAVADLAYRRGTLSSGVPTQQIALQSALLIVLLALIVVGLGSPSASVGRLHLISPVVVGAYMLGLCASRRLGRAQSRQPGGADVEGGRSGMRGKVGRVESPPNPPGAGDETTTRLWLRFAGLATVMVACGFVLARAGSELAGRTALSAASVGFLFTSLATSTPELVTAVAAARRGAVGLAAGDIIGGNVFDTLFVAAADAASPQVVFAEAGPAAIGMAGLALLLNGLLLSGLVRQGAGARHVDVENLAVVLVWLAAVVILLV